MAVNTQTSKGERERKYIVKHGILFHQRNVFNENQIQSIIHHFDDLSKAPKLLFADKAADKFRNANQSRKCNRHVLAAHDRTFGYGIPVFWKDAKTMRPSLQRFKTMMDEQFEPLRQHLLSGYHVVIQEGKPRADYSRNGKGVILHNLGVNSLPFAYVQYIQHKIDELHNFVRFDRNVVEYNPKYKHISHGTDNRHEREQNTPNRCIDCGRKDFGKIYDGDGLFYCNRCWMYYDMKVDEHHKGNSGYKAYNKQPQLKCPHGSLKKGVYRHSWRGVPGVEDIVTQKNDSRNIESQLRAQSAKSNHLIQPQPKCPHGSLSAKELINIKIRKRNVCYVVGLPIDMANEQKLRTHEWFGRFGNIIKIAIRRNKKANSISTHITYDNDISALNAINSCNNFIFISDDGRKLKARFGAQHYCRSFITPIKKCIKKPCGRLHSWCAVEDIITQKEINDFNAIHSGVDMRRNIESQPLRVHSEKSNHPKQERSTIDSATTTPPQSSRIRKEHAKPPIRTQKAKTTAKRSQNRSKTIASGNRDTTIAHMQFKQQVWEKEQQLRAQIQQAKKKEQFRKQLAQEKQMRINTERESQRASIARTNTARAAHAQIQQAKHEKEQFRKQAAQEKQKRINTERENQRAVSPRKANADQHRKRKPKSINCAHKYSKSSPRTNRASKTRKRTIP
eukprot:953510_1